MRFKVSPCSFGFLILSTKALGYAKLPVQIARRCDWVCECAGACSPEINWYSILDEFFPLALRHTQDPLWLWTHKGNYNGWINERKVQLLKNKCRNLEISYQSSVNAGCSLVAKLWCLLIHLMWFLIIGMIEIFLQLYRGCTVGLYVYAPQK